MLGVSRAGGGTGKLPALEALGKGKKRGRSEESKSIFSPGEGVLSRRRGVNYRGKERGKYVSVYSIIHSVSYCRHDTSRMRVSRWFEVSVFPPELTKWMCLPFFFGIKKARR